jgi:cob(I)alamin adenosyltransferase
MARIYTRSGDSGETGLIGGARVSKADPVIEAVGLLDELNAALGWALCASPPEMVSEHLRRVQSLLFDIGAEVASPAEGEWHMEASLAGEDEKLERGIDFAEAQLEPLRQFILPGGAESAARLHLARATCRRAERHLVGIGVREDVVRFVNRLSDFLFVAARLANKENGVPDVPWSRTS